VLAPSSLLNSEQAGLYERIKTFRFDEGDSTYPFFCRLGRENGWSGTYAARAITEYRKFVFLALVAGHPVTPSDQVDQVWHLHLLYTQSYWKRFCGETLGRPLHHEPTKGGHAERDKFGSWYAATNESYRRYFGEAPPSDIWPAANTRFGDDLHFERVNRSRFWVIPKTWSKACLVLAGLLLAWFL
jgi:hypothetical protein